MSGKVGLPLLLGAVFLMVGLIAIACGPAATPTATPTPTQAPPTPTPTVAATTPAPPPSPTPTTAPTAQTPSPPATTPMASPTPTTAPPAAVTPAGTLVMAVQTVGTRSGNPRDCPFCSFLVVAGVQETLVMASRESDGSLGFQPMLAESWQTAPDLSYTDFKIRRGVQFHQGFGELTAEDVAYTFNSANPNVTQGAIHDTGGDLIPVLERVEVIDPQTARFHWLSFGSHTIPKFTGDFHEGIGIFSKRAFDQQGDQWLRENVIGTGPFMLEQWVQNQGITIGAVRDHWRKTPFVERIRILEVPETSTRRAMLETGEAQIANIALKDWPALLGRGFAKSPEGSLQEIAFVFGGNYWETQQPRTGEALQRTLDTTKPWVGDPKDPASMERARKVRWALSLAIDREGINETIAAGQGRVSYLGNISDTDPVFQANADRWTVPYDPDQARQMLQEAGYPEGFTLDFWVGPSGIEVEIFDAVAAGWLSELNVQTNFDRQAYATFRPTRINRTTSILSVFGGDAHLPSTWPNEWLYSAVAAPGGFNAGMEIPKATETVLAKERTVDQAELERITTDFYNYWYEQMLQPGVVELPAYAIYNTNRIAEWQMRPGSTLLPNYLGGIRAPEWIRLTGP